MFGQQTDVPMQNALRYQALERQTANALQTNVQRPNMTDNITTRQQFGKSHFRTTFRFAQMVRRYRIGVEAEIRARIDAGDVVFECFPYDIVQILPGRLLRNVRVRNGKLAPLMRVGTVAAAAAIRVQFAAVAHRRGRIIALTGLDRCARIQIGIGVSHLLINVLGKRIRLAEKHNDRDLFAVRQFRYVGSGHDRIRTDGCVMIAAAGTDGRSVCWHINVVGGFRISADQSMEMGGG